MPITGGYTVGCDHCDASTTRPNRSLPPGWKELANGEIVCPDHVVRTVVEDRLPVGNPAPAGDGAKD